MCDFQYLPLRPSEHVAGCFEDLVSTIYTFKAMCDFQYLPLRPSEHVAGCFEDLVTSLIPTDLNSAMSWWNHPDKGRRLPLHLPPYQFS
ncbi:unnamed protein product, partial [Gongylonema pulchrum]|uniref:DDE_Tnp_1_7 domain-containing protein n=1 Tax=Gongylonema pulchrum TaxID=637853 RepID=A0A183EUZ5_9BILA